MRTLVVTNDFPTRRGGIETFVLSLCAGLDPGDVEVYTASMPGAAEHDARLPYAVHRDPTSMLLPTSRVRDRVVEVFRASGAEVVVFGASAPLGLLGPSLRKAGARRVVALTHGHEVWWARTPGPRQLLHRIGEGADVLTYVSAWCRDRIAPALSKRAATRMQPLAPGVEPDRFRPGCGGAEVRRRLGIGTDEPVIVCTARMVRRKGQDRLIAALGSVPGARLVLVGDGPDRARLQQLATPLGDRVLFTGSVPWEQVPAYTDLGDVFAMPCRTRLGGLEPEALGIVFLEAAACGLPVIVGDSGGAPETVSDGRTGYVVPDDRTTLVGRLRQLVADPELAREMGARGRARVEADWTWSRSQERLRSLLG